MTFVMRRGNLEAEGITLKQTMKIGHTATYIYIGTVFTRSKLCLRILQSRA